MNSKTIGLIASAGLSAAAVLGGIAVESESNGGVTPQEAAERQQQALDLVASTPATSVSQSASAIVADGDVTIAELDRAFAEARDCVNEHFGDAASIQHNGAGDLTVSFRSESESGLEDVENEVDDCISRHFNLAANVFAVRNSPTESQRLAIADCSALTQSNLGECMERRSAEFRAVSIMNATDE